MWQLYPFAIKCNFDVIFCSSATDAARATIDAGGDRRGRRWGQGRPIEPDNFGAEYGMSKLYYALAAITDTECDLPNEFLL